MRANIELIDAPLTEEEKEYAVKYEEMTIKYEEITSQRYAIAFPSAHLPTDTIIGLSKTSGSLIWNFSVSQCLF